MSERRQLFSSHDVARPPTQNSATISTPLPELPEGLMSYGISVPASACRLMAKLGDVDHYAPKSVQRMPRTSAVNWRTVSEPRRHDILRRCSSFLYVIEARAVEAHL